MSADSHIFDLNAAALEIFDEKYKALRHCLDGAQCYRSIRVLNDLMKIHDGTRKDGVTPSFQHQIEIAFVLYNCRQFFREKDLDKIIALALLHDTPEDKGMSYREVGERYGKDLPHALERLTKELNGEKKSTDVYYAEMLDDLYACIVKPADRWHNLRSMVAGLPDDRLAGYIQETREHVFPMLDQARKTYPRYEGYFRLMKRNMENVCDSLCRMVDIMQDPQRRDTITDSFQRHALITPTEG